MANGGTKGGGVAGVRWRAYWWLERRLAPGVRYAQSAFEDALFAAVESGCEWLDFGCGRELLPPWREVPEKVLVRRPSRLVGVDPDRGALSRHRRLRLRVCGDGGALPFPDAQFDLVTANMVVEHLAEPEREFREITRVLKQGGRFVLHTPNATGYSTLLARGVPDAARGLAARLLESRNDADRFPTFYRANSVAALGQLASSAGLVVDRIELVRSVAMFALVTPLAALELLLLRALGSRRLAWLRPNLIAVLRKGEPR